VIITGDPSALRGEALAGCAFVPTMGALHEGHAALIRAAAKRGPAVVSVFVNPTQFGPGEDLDRYPRDLDGDAAVAERAGAALLFAPDVATVYPPGFVTVVDPGPLAADLCGRARPGHFAGVATVVTRLLGLVRPRWLLLGLKDRQQVVVLRRVVDDLALGVDVVGVPTVRDADGLALSSRNAYLSETERVRAAVIPRALALAAGTAGDADAILAAARSALDVAAIVPEYLELRDAEDLGPWQPHREGVLLVAARVGDTRLIDNIDVPRSTEVHP
jgi:pantoate--beta-alanine ligase